MTTATVGQELLTAADLLRRHSKGVKGELVRGELRETVSSGGEHGEIAGALIAEIRACVRPRRMGRVSGSDAGVRLERTRIRCGNRTSSISPRKNCLWM